MRFRKNKYESIKEFSKRIFRRLSNCGCEILFLIKRTKAARYLFGFCPLYNEVSTFVKFAPFHYIFFWVSSLSNLNSRYCLRKNFTYVSSAAFVTENISKRNCPFFYVIPLYKQEFVPVPIIAAIPGSVNKTPRQLRAYLNKHQL
jgi:hypothetical protein